jgi:predicted outer membrane repeat protein
MLRFLKSLVGRGDSRRTVRPTPRSFRPALESLEGRLVPSTLTVTKALDNGTAGTLRYEVRQANADAARGVSDTINFAGNVRGTLTLSSPLELTRAANKAWVTINGGGNINLSGGSAHQVLKVDAGADVHLLNLTVEYGKATSGGGITNSGILDLNRCLFVRNSASDGGAIFNAGIMMLNHCTLNYNSATHSGGAIDNTGSIQGSDDFFSFNTATSGGAVANKGTLSLDGSRFANNTGSALYNGNFANVTHTTFAANSAKYGGAIYDDGILFISKDVFSYNRAAFRGGALFVTAYAGPAFGGNFHSDASNQYLNNWDPAGSGDGYFA